jgi:diguanylate cyclase (GGDEF)-like protein/PAS domain S-box-containing protein
METLKGQDRFSENTKFFHKAILNNIPDIAWLKDKEGRYIAVNVAFCLVCGTNMEELIGKNDLDIWPKELAEKYRADDREVMQLGMQKVFEEHLLNKDGKLLWVETIKTPIYNDRAEVIGTTGIARDITYRKQLEQDLHTQRSQLEAVVQERTTELSKANEELRREINVRKKIEERLRQLSLRDPHTGLYTHRYLQESIEAEFFRARRYAHNLSAIMLDVDYFKSINDVYGHQFGDMVLKQLARQLKRLVRRYDIVSRFGGEEFVIVSPGIDRLQACALAQRILDALNLFNFGDDKQTVKLKLSLAVASYPEDGISKGMGLVNLTEQILNKAKEGGGNRVYSSIDIRKRKEAALEKGSRKAEIKVLKRELQKITSKANQNLVESIFALAKTIELKDHYTGEHVEKTVHYATEIAGGLRLSREEIELVKQAAMLHDLGKIGISENILQKRAPLTEKEFEMIKKHPQIGADIIRPIQFLRSLIPFIFYHHERWDGKGYPSGVKGEEIPIGARIIAIADVYQALISDRPYRKAYSQKEAVKIIKSGSGNQFDPRITNIFLEILKKDK